MLPPKTEPRLAPAAGIHGMLLVLLLTACAAPNPLMQEPATASAKDAKPAAAQTAQAAPAPAAASAVPAPVVQAPPAKPAAVQTTQDRRFFGIFSPYRADIQQGNFVSEEMVAQLKQGMTPDQVRFVLGTPLLTDVFHANRWDYVFRLKKGNGEVTTSRIAVFFKDTRLARVEGGDLPTEKDYLARLAGAAPEVATPASPASAPSVPAEAAKAAAPSAAAPK
jgi:outer membrane protein assembly factor BamE